MEKTDIFNKKIWDRIERKCGLPHKSFDYRMFAEAIKEIYPEVSYAEYCLLIADYNKKIGKSGAQIFIPEAFKWFIEKFANKFLPSKVLVPFATGVECGLMADSIDTTYHFTNKEIEEITKSFIDIKTVNEIGNDKQYDFIFSELPLGPVDARSISNQIVERCVQLLTAKGYAAFTFAKTIALQLSKKWLDKLEGKGFYCNAIIDMPVGSYAPVTMVDSEIVIFSKTKSDKIFTGLIAEESYAEPLVDNFLEKKESKSGTKLGVYVSGDVRCYSDFLKVSRIVNKNKSLSKAYNGESIKISSLGVVYTPDRNNEFKKLEGSVYVPKLGNSPVEIDFSELHIKPQNYFQIVLNTEKMLPRFLAFFLNTEEGLNLRQLSYKCVTIGAFNAKTLGEMEVPCPSIELQSEYLKTYSQLEALRVEVENLKNKLQKIPESYKNIRKEMKDINNNGDKFAQWIESLPYPIATILKRYSVADDVSKKQETLFFFFEAYAIFEATLLSAALKVALNKNLIDCGALNGVDPSYFLKPSFGSWVRMDRGISKIFLCMVNSSEEEKEKKKIALECFKTTDEHLVKLLCNTTVCNILETASSNRNTWKGHSGITSDVLYKEHVDILDSQLYKLQENIKDLYEKIRLIRIISLKFSKGVYTSRVEVLTGSNSIFVKDTIKSLVPLEEKLYIQIIDTGEVLDLPLYFKLENSPVDAKNACYFYNRVEESGNTRYVSYHYDGKPEDMEKGDVAFQYIKDMFAN